MPSIDPPVWPLRGANVSPAAAAALVEHAAHDAAAMRIDVEAYGTWTAGALEGDEDAGPTRCALASTALAAVPLLEHVRALHEVGALRRARANDLVTIEGLAAWTDAEVQLTIATAQRRLDDPSSPRNRLAALGRAAGTLGHELRNPLGVIQSSVYLLGRNAHLDEKQLRHAEKIGRQATICHRIIEDLMHLARNAPPRLESLDVSEAFALAVEEAALPSVVMCRIEAPPGLRVHADAGLLQRALVNLLRNANEAMRSSGAVRLGVLEHDDALDLWVRDHGPGFEPAMLEHAFDPLATTSGIGLGLALVDSIMRRHGGSATARNEPEGGARVTLHFPRRSPDLT